MYPLWGSGLMHKVGVIPTGVAPLFCLSALCGENRINPIGNYRIDRLSFFQEWKPVFFVLRIKKKGRPKTMSEINNPLNDFLNMQEDAAPMFGGFAFPFAAPEAVPTAPAQNPTAPVPQPVQQAESQQPIVSAAAPPMDRCSKRQWHKPLQASSR